MNAQTQGAVRLATLLQEALARPPEERPGFLDAACGSDRELRGRLEELLRLAEAETERWRAAPLETVHEPEGLYAWESTLPRPGQQLGRYRIVGLLGRGGMGRVYRAVDPALDREVAIKSVAGTFEDDAPSLRRFEREARVLAALNHPAIATVYGFETIEGAPYLVLELVAGETLQERLERGPLGVREATAVGRQVAEALEEAHRKGIVHRDLKPPNVMLGPGGRVKVLDFGLAKSVPGGSEAAYAGPSASVATASGTVLGTAPYMSPEQARGGEIDTRTDVWAFGCLLYEMLSGRRAFQARTVPDVLASILRDEPELERLPAETPPQLRLLVERCLRKDPHERLQDIGDARLELAELATTQRGAMARSGREAARSVPRNWASWGIAAAALALTAAMIAMAIAPRPARRTLRLSLELPAGIALERGVSPPFALSPDGARLAVVGSRAGAERLYVRELGELRLRALPGTEGARQPFFSPDGRWIAYFAGRKLQKVPVEGGPPVVLAEVGSNFRGGAWAPDGTIVFAPSQTSGLQRLPEGGGPPAALTTLEPGGTDASHRWPEVLPGGEWVLFTAAEEEASYDEARLEAVSLRTGERRAVLENAAFGRHLPGGGGWLGAGDRLLFARAGLLHAVPFSPRRTRVEGESAVLVAGVSYDARNGAAHVAVGGTARGSVPVLLYAPATPAPTEHHLARLAPDGSLARLVPAPRRFGQPRVSPDGSRIALRVGAGEASDLWVLDTGSGTLLRLSVGLAPHRPTWRPDGRAIAIATGSGGRWRLATVPAAGGGAPATLLEGERRMAPNDWSPDGRRLVLQQRSPRGDWDLVVLALDVAGRPLGGTRPLAATPFHEANASISPDGALVAYESDEVDGVVQVYVRSFDDGAGRVAASSDGARSPRWLDERRLAFFSSTRRELRTVEVERAGGRLGVRGERLAIPPERRELADRRVIVTPVDGFDVDREGGFVVLETAAPDQPPPLAEPVLVVDPP